MNELSQLQSLGLELPSPWYLAGALVFGLLGWVAYRHGKRTQNAAVKWAGVALMLYPYAVTQTWLLWLSGVVLCGFVWWQARQG